MINETQQYKMVLTQDYFKITFQVNLKNLNSWIFIFDI